MSGTAGTAGDTVAGRVTELARAEASARGLDVLDVDVRGGRPTVVTVTVDVDVPDEGRAAAGQPPHAPVDIDVIADLSRALDGALVAGGVVGEDATLEVSSPGTERPLVTARDLVRNLGRDVEVTLADSALRGRLVAVEDGRVVLAVDGSEQHVPLGDLVTARLVLPW